ncbi:MAG: tyramine oxidase subunit B [Pseudomonadota bacterium]
MSYPQVDFLYLNEEDMIKAGVKDMAACIEAMDEMLRLLKIGDFRMGGENGNSHGVMMTFPTESPFPNMPVDGPDRRFMAMPAYLGGRFDMAGVKWYGSNVENKKKGLPRSILMLTLNDKDTGAPLAYMSANVLSAYRTGAIPGVGYKYLARKDAKVMGIIGPGVMGRTALAAAMAVRPDIEVVKVKGRSATSPSTLNFVDYVKAEYPSIKEVYAVETVEEVVRDADIVTSAPSVVCGDFASFPYIKGEWVKKGAIISCPGAALFDDDFLLNNVRNVVDNIKLYEAWAEEYPYPTYNVIPMPALRNMDLIHEGKATKDCLEDLGDMLVGKIPMRQNDDEIFVYSVGGMPVEDVAWGTICYRKALELGIGTKLNLWTKPDLA